MVCVVKISIYTDDLQKVIGVKDNITINSEIVGHANHEFYF